jgi:ubiquinone biosynthesis protein UbiJ
MGGTFPMLPMLSTFPLATINHLLVQEPWARQQLLRHAGKVAAVVIGAATVRLRVGGDGLVEAAPVDEAAAMTIRVAASDLPLILQNRERAISYVTIDGDAEFANTISQLAATLRWDAGHDLEKVVGPIAATRLVDGARALFGAAVTGQRKLAENVAEFLTEEQAVLVRPALVESLRSGVVRLRDDVERAAKRLERLEQKLARMQDQRVAIAPASPSTDHQ